MFHAARPQPSFSGIKQGSKNQRIIWRFEKSKLAGGVLIAIKVKAINLRGNAAHGLAVYLRQKELGFSVLK